MNRNKIIIEWHSILKDLIKNLWVVVLSVLIGYMGIYIVDTIVYEPEYTSSATLVVTTKGSGNSAFSHFVTSSEMADIYTNVFVDPVMKEKAAAHAEYDYFKGKISASVLPSTNFLRISVTSGDPQSSYDLLQSVLAVYPEISKNIFENAVINVLTPPSVPKNATNAVSSTNTTIIISGIAVLVIFAILVLSIMRDTVKNTAAFEDRIDGKLLGTIPHENKRMTLKDKINKKKKSLLIVGNAFISLKFTEQFHTIAAKLEREKHNSKSKVFAITSVAENEGKSTVASNIAVSLAERGHKVALIDFDGKKPALYKIFGQKFNEQTELGYYFKEDYAGEFKFRRFKKSSLYLALNTMPHKDYYEWLHNEKCQKLMAYLRENMDFIIIDTAPISADTTITDMGEIADRTILVVRTDVVSTPVINDTITTIGNVGGNVMGCILNDVYPDFTLFSMSGVDEGGYRHYGKHGYGRYKYGKYGKYSKYHKYSKYGKYSNYKNTTED